MSSKTPYGPYDVTQGGVGEIIGDPTILAVQALSGATEPVWPTTEYATVSEGGGTLNGNTYPGITWTAIYARRARGAVTGVLNPAVFQHNKLVYPHHYFQYGTINWLTGLNAGFKSDVRDSYGVNSAVTPPTAPYIYMLEIAPNPIAIGDTFEATVGCAKLRDTCQRFNNFDNFRGFPDMPTEERAIQTPNISSQGWAPKQTK